MCEQKQGQTTAMYDNNNNIIMITKTGPRPLRLTMKTTATTTTTRLPPRPSPAEPSPTRKLHHPHPDQPPPLTTSPQHTYPYDAREQRTPVRLPPQYLRLCLAWSEYPAKQGAGARRAVRVLFRETCLRANLFQFETFLSKIRVIYEGFRIHPSNSS